MSTQTIILKWIILVYDLVPSKASLHKLYPLFFHYLDYESLRYTMSCECLLNNVSQWATFSRPLLATILYRITRREDVLPFRVRRLYVLQAKNPGDQAILGLMMLFKVRSLRSPAESEFLTAPYQEYDHNMIISSKAKGRVTTLFKIPDRVWHQQIERVQEKAGHVAQAPELPFGLPSQHTEVSPRMSSFACYQNAMLTLTRLCSSPPPPPRASGAPRRRCCRLSRQRRTRRSLCSLAARSPVPHRLLRCRSRPCRTRVERGRAWRWRSCRRSRSSPPSWRTWSCNQLAAVLSNRFLQHTLALDASRTADGSASRCGPSVA